MKHFNMPMSLKAFYLQSPVFAIQMHSGHHVLEPNKRHQILLVPTLQAEKVLCLQRWGENEVQAKGACRREEGLTFVVFGGCITSILKHLLELFLIPYKNEQKCMSFLVEKSQASCQRIC